MTETFSWRVEICQTAFTLRARGGGGGWNVSIEKTKFFDFRTIWEGDLCKSLYNISLPQPGVRMRGVTMQHVYYKYTNGASCVSRGASFSLA